MQLTAEQEEVRDWRPTADIHISIEPSLEWE